jgi:hypothetical protein
MAEASDSVQLTKLHASMSLATHTLALRWVGSRAALSKCARAYKKLWNETKCEASPHCKPQIQRAGSKQAQLASSIGSRAYLAAQSQR